MYKILFLASGTGGTQIFNKVRSYLELLGIDTLFLTVSPVVKDLFPNTIHSDKIKDALYIIKQFNPDIIFTETSNPKPLQYNTLSIIKSYHYIVSIQDVWDAQGIRYEKFMPNLICTPTPTTKQHLERVGITNTFLYTNPTFIDFKKNINIINRKNPRILYASQGRDYYKYFKVFLKYLQQLYLNPDITIQLHPEEKDLQCEFKTIRSKELPYGYDLVIGYNSTILLKSLLIGIPTIFYDVNVHKNFTNYKEGKDIIVNKLYQEFLSCADEELFYTRTNDLLFRILGDKFETPQSLLNSENKLNELVWEAK